MAPEELTIRFSIQGTPVAKARARTYAQTDSSGQPIMKNGKLSMKTKTPDKTKGWETYVSLICRQAAANNRLQEVPRGPVVLGCIFYMPIPKSWSKKKKAEALAGTLLPTPKPDLSNFIKAIEDAGEKVLWDNDSQIIGYGTIDGVITSKRYSNKPRVDVEIRYIG